MRQLCPFSRNNQSNSYRNKEKATLGGRYESDGTTWVSGRRTKKGPVVLTGPFVRTGVF